MSATHGPVIIEAALNGVTSKNRNPAVPITPEEHARDGVACVDAGATVIHTHTEHVAAPPDVAAAEYAQAYQPIVGARLASSVTRPPASAGRSKIGTATSNCSPTPV